MAVRVVEVTLRTELLLAYEATVPDELIHKVQFTVALLSVILKEKFGVESDDSVLAFAGDSRFIVIGVLHWVVFTIVMLFTLSRSSTRKSPSFKFPLIVVRFTPIARGRVLKSDELYSPRTSQK